MQIILLQESINSKPLIIPTKRPIAGILYTVVAFCNHFGYPQTSDISRTLVDNNIDHPSDLVRSALLYICILNVTPGFNR